jgi:ABC-type antimicrobial peptide transport system permease subunit
VFGVMAFAVAARREELALRVALGATPGRLRASVLRRAGGVALAGSAAGAALSLWLLRAIASALYGVSPADPITIAIAVATVAACTLAAAAIPAWRASAADPMVVLRKS